jgi:membrane protein implicated in regulation of membrane protease activity
MDAWMVWILIGILCFIIEIFDPAFFFISLGIGALLTGLIMISGFAKDLIWLQIIIFAVISFVAFLFMRKVAKKFLKAPLTDTNVYALKGKNGHVTKAIPAEGKGYVKIGGEEWSAISKDTKEIEKDAKVVVSDIEGNKLIVEKI